MTEENIVVRPFKLIRPKLPEDQGFEFLFGQNIRNSYTYTVCSNKLMKTRFNNVWYGYVYTCNRISCQNL